MSSQPLLILAPRVTDDSVAVWRAAMKAGWNTQRLSNWRVPEGMKAHVGDIAIYAEPLFAEAVADQMGLALIEPSHDWLVRLPTVFRHREVSLQRLSEARLSERVQFVKPAQGKVFEPKVYERGAQLPSIDQIGDIEVLVSEPVSFTLEVRCFVLAGEVVTASPYWRDEALAQAADGSWPFLADEEAEAMAFARQVLSHPDVAAPPAFVLDVGITAEHGWAVIEGNPCWGAGLYGCDAMTVLTTAKRAIVRRAELAMGDRQWIMSRHS